MHNIAALNNKTELDRISRHYKTSPTTTAALHDMPLKAMQPFEYEDLVKSIMSSIIAATPSGELVEVRGGPRNKILGNSSLKHQIDVSVHFGNRLLLCECKLWNDPIGVEAVLVLLGRLMDISIKNPNFCVCGSIVSQQAPTHGALLLASAYGIALETVKSSEEYGLKIFNHIFIGMREEIYLKDTAEAAIIPSQKSN